VGYDVQFVDGISSTPSVRLDLALAPWNVRDTTEFTPPELRRSVVSTQLADGDRYPAAAYGNRVITLVVQILGTTDDATASALQRLMRELDRPSNILRYRPGTSQPVFFRTFRCGPSDVQWDPVEKAVTAHIPADSFGYGLRETLPTVIVSNDMVDQLPANANPYFETNAANWTATGGTIARSTAQAHEGAASLLLTPDGVTATVDARSELVTASPGQSWRASAWVRCAVARNVTVNINWRNSVGGLISTSSSTVAVAATTWTLLDLPATTGAPALTAQAQITVSMGPTPPASNTLHIDEARIRPAGPGAGGCCWDITGVKGDVETPLFMSIAQGSISSPDRRQSVIAVRRRGTPSAAPFVLQAEAMSLVGTADTTLGAANDPLMSGPGQNYLRTTFVTFATMRRRASIDPWPAAASDDVRGTYRVYGRTRKAVGADVISMRLVWGGGGSLIFNDIATLRAASDNIVQYADLGLVQFPVGADPVTDGYSGDELAARGLYFEIQAARTSGTGNLDIDCLVFMPADDRQALISWAIDAAATAFVVDPARTMIYAVGASGEVRTAGLIELTSALPMVSPAVTNRIAFLQDTGQLSAGGDLLANSTTISPYYWPRYLSVAPVGS
jgi:hypothetical protein